MILEPHGWQLECDGCRSLLANPEGGDSFASEDDMFDTAQREDWGFADDDWYCPRCKEMMENDPDAGGLG